MIFIYHNKSYALFHDRRIDAEGRLQYMNDMKIFAALLALSLLAPAAASASEQSDAEMLCLRKLVYDTNDGVDRGVMWSVENEDGGWWVRIPARAGIYDYTLTCTVRDGKIVEFYWPW